MLSQLQGRPGLVVAVSQYEHRLRDTVEQIKAIVTILDGDAELEAAFFRRSFVQRKLPIA